MENTPRRRRVGKIVAFAAAAAVACGIAVLLFFEAPLWWELSNAATESLGDGDDWRLEQLHNDVEVNLLRYSPQRLARYLKSPSENCRGVVCLALQRHSDKDPAHWAGIPTALAHTAVSASSAKLTMLCFEALRSAPEYSATDVRSIVDAMTVKTMGIPELMLDELARRSPLGRDELKMAMRKRLGGSFAPGQAAAFRLLIRFFPEVDEPVAAYASTAFSNGEGELQNVAALKTLLSRRPDIGRNFLAGTQGEKHVLWLALATTSASDATDDPALVAAAEQAAAAAIAAPNVVDLDAIVRFLGGTSNGFSILFRGLESRNDDFIGKVLSELQRQYLAVKTPRTSFRGFTAAEAEIFVRLLPRIKGDQERSAWERIIGAAVSDWLPRNTFPRGAGPTDPRLADFLTNAIEDHRTDSIVAYFEIVSPFTEKEIPRILKCFASSFQHYDEFVKDLRRRAKEASADPPQVLTERLLFTQGQTRFASLLLKRFPAHPEVRAFFARYPSVRKQVENYEKPTQLIGSGSHPL